ERFNGSFRRGVLNAFTFETMDQVREQAEIWINDYNNSRPHESLGNVPPVMYAQKVLI
ncbi:MAG: integrase core domain-containing protein, partial [Flavobacteriales bacterium]|nr:integrase core domain-containing protein [Flavobacteriales bacterium]